ncbi:MAG: O-antigen ligase family protein [Clostridia bacterium]|nr:O-antigen ligase family protein [Clostridia bacterium]
MAKRINAKDRKKSAEVQQEAKAQQKKKESRGTDAGSYWFAMSHAPTLNENLHWFNMLPVVFFSAVIIMIVHAAGYTRPMDQFFWYVGSNDLTDFFSYYKMVCILVCAVLALVFLLFRLATQSLAIRYSYIYIPLAVYALCVILSYAMSDYKDFSLLGYNDRFEGTLPILAYIVMLFYIINTVRGERDIKILLVAIAVTSAVLALLGISQAADHDFFRTALGQKLLMPNAATPDGSTVYEQIDNAAAQGKQLLSFTFQNREIYQTVYNINYVSFYLTLLVPTFGMLFIMLLSKLKETAEKKKTVLKAAVLALLFGLLVFNLIGSASSGGYMGMAFAVLLAIIIANRRIVKWIKPLAVLIVITLIVGGITYDRWSSELGIAFDGLTTEASETEEPAAASQDGAGSGAEAASTGDAAGTSDAAAEKILADNGGDQNISDQLDALAADVAAKQGKDVAEVRAMLQEQLEKQQEDDTESAVDGHGKVDYIVTDRNDVNISYLGEVVKFTTIPDSPTSVYVHDGDGNSLELVPTNVSPIYKVNDPRFEFITVRPAQDESNKQHYIIIGTAGDEWPFLVSEDGVKYVNAFGKTCSLRKVEAGWFADNPSFGSGRGYIWSRTFPLMKDTVLLGHGADTYCLYFPHDDYVGKYNSAGWANNLTMIVDKPHNMYMGMWVGTGGISVIAFVAMLIIYFVQTVRIYWRRKYETFAEYAGFGIFLGVMGFAATGLVDDSTVSVMPMFYGLLGTGIAINMMLAKDMPKKEGKKKNAAAASEAAAVPAAGAENDTAAEE